VKRGDIVVVATRGVYSSKPRPAVIVQSEPYTDTHASLTVCPCTSTAIDAPNFRVGIAAGPRTGLATPSFAMVDKIISVPRRGISRAIGTCAAAEMAAIDEALRNWLGL